MRTRSRITLIVLAVAVIVAAALATLQHFRRDDLALALARYGPAARAKWAPLFARAKLEYPPRELTLLIFKEEKRVAVWGKGKDGRWRFVRDFPVLAASGHAGPKLRQGDYQVPEGLYRIELLNPRSSYHLSMKVGYPNELDRRIAAAEHRTQLGGDIFIHGSSVSIGCVAIGDPAIEQLFTLVADTGLAHVRVILAPNDLRVASAPVTRSTPAWVIELYRSIAVALQPFPVEMESNSFFNVRGMPKVKALFRYP